MNPLRRERLFLQLRLMKPELVELEVSGTPKIPDGEVFVDIVINNKTPTYKATHLLSRPQLLAFMKILRILKKEALTNVVVSADITYLWLLRRFLTEVTWEDLDAVE